MASINNNFKPDKPNTSQLNNCGILISDISDEKGGVETKDKHIKAKSLKNGFEKLKESIEAEEKFKRVAFIGKQAAKWFFIYFLTQ